MSTPSTKHGARSAKQCKAVTDRTRSPMSASPVMTREVNEVETKPTSLEEHIDHALRDQKRSDPTSTRSRPHVRSPIPPLSIVPNQDNHSKLLDLQRQRDYLLATLRHEDDKTTRLLGQLCTLEASTSEASPQNSSSHDKKQSKQERRKIMSLLRKSGDQQRAILDNLSRATLELHKIEWGQPATSPNMRPFGPTTPGQPMPHDISQAGLALETLQMDPRSPFFNPERQASPPGGPSRRPQQDPTLRPSPTSLSQACLPFHQQYPALFQGAALSYASPLPAITTDYFGNQITPPAPYPHPLAQTAPPPSVPAFPPPPILRRHPSKLDRIAESAAMAAQVSSEDEEMADQEETEEAEFPPTPAPSAGLQAETSSDLHRAPLVDPDSLDEDELEPPLRRFSTGSLPPHLG
ncbi:MAG: hypothetical protein M1817_005254 [Caeruleum heppii]|nr:MAG: hypothetical protein M1817_005254 [Caeruleum heppii]